MPPVFPMDREKAVTLMLHFNNFSEELWVTLSWPTPHPLA